MWARSLRWAPPMSDQTSSDRRAWLESVGLVGALVAAAGTFAAFAVRFLFPAKSKTSEWQFVAEVARLGPGKSMAYTAPDGSTITVARRGPSLEPKDFVALSSTCPHLGCKVHWEAQNSRFFCPCHNGAFDPNGKATEGPPAEAGQSLPEYPLRIKGGLLFIDVPLEKLAANEAQRLTKPGHDGCLAAKKANGRGQA